MVQNWGEKSVLIIGAARQGLALARFLAQQGARVTVNDKRTAEQMTSVQTGMAAYPIEWAFGSHDPALLEGKNMVCISGGIPLNLPIVEEVFRRGIPLSNDSQIFMDMVPCPVIGITGSAGKTTTTTLISRMAEAAVQPPKKSWVGGNIGMPLIDHLQEINPKDLVILELSSFQLEQMTISPQIAAITNITPNHLDRHGTFANYLEAKARILAFQKDTDIAVLNREDPASRGLMDRVKGKLITFGLSNPCPTDSGTFYENGKLYLCTPEGRVEIMGGDVIRLRGMHNVQNVLAACAIAHAAGFPISAMQAGVNGFKGVPHRLEFVRTLHGADWYNDSIATAPERTMAAIKSYHEPLVLMLGGRDKNLPWEDLADLIHQRVDHVVVFGEAAEKILRALGDVSAGQRPYTIDHCPNLQCAVEAAALVAGPGDVVLLSPGGTSFDEFQDFEERGEQFREWVNRLS